MTSYKANDIIKALKKKGFRNTPSKHHIMLYLFDDNGMQTAIHTWISHDHKEYSGNLLGEMKRELGLQTSRELDDLIKCPLEYPKYIQLLRERGML